jgi:phosphate transport system substrate-binding protein
VKHRVSLAAVVFGVLVLATSASAGGPAPAAAGSSVIGSGSSFVYPLVSQWVKPLEQARGITLQYEPTGSGEGVAAITAREVDFGATDAPLTASQRRACRGCLQIPWALSATSVAYNLPGVRSGLRLSGPLIAQIFLGTVTRWNAPAIRRLNPHVALPDLAIIPVHRSDASGTSYSFSQYLAAVSRAARSQIGVSTLPRWPTGPEAEGSSGVVAYASGIEGAVTYVNVADALQNRLRIASVANRAGRWTIPTLPAIAAAADTVKRVPETGELTIVDPPRTAPVAYPIATFTYVIVPSATSIATTLRTFLRWAVTDGQKFGPALLFQRLPAVVQTFANRQIARIRRSQA